MAEFDCMHLMFCEGPHDAAFVGKLLVEVLAFKKIKINLTQIPDPVGAVLMQGMKTRAAEDLRLDLAKKFLLPDYCLRRERILVLIFNYGGGSRPKSVPILLEPVFSLLSEPYFSLMVPLKYVIYADADALGSSSARQAISSDLARIGEYAWLSNDWGRMPGVDCAAEQESEFGRVAACIWRALDKDVGTLEDIILECLAEDSSFARSRQFADSHFSWPDLSVPVAAKRAKAAICIEGQGKKPGSSMAVVIDQSGILSRERLLASRSVQEHVKFLQAWLGI